MIVLKIALRNLLEHRAKTVIVGTLIVLAVALMVTGNSIMDSIRRGLQQSYSQNYTGDLIVHGLSSENFSLVAMGGNTEIPLLPAFPTLRDGVEKIPGVSETLPLVSGAASLIVNEEMVSFTLLWGTDFSMYRKMFPDTVEIVEGAYPQDEGAYLLLSQTVRESAEKELGHRIALGDTVTLGGFGAGGTRLRTAKIAGFFKFKRGNAQLDRISLVSAGTLRSLKGMTLKPASAYASATGPSGSTGTTGTTETTGITGTTGTSGTTGTGTAESAVSDAALFGDPNSLVQAPSASSSGSEKINFDRILGDTSIRNAYSDVDPNAWNFLLVRTSPSASVTAVQHTLRNYLTQQGLEAAVSDWSWGAGPVATLALSLQLIFNIIIFIILVVAVIIIMNTLVISVTERIAEIGTIRAIGGGKPFIRKMIVWETLTLSITAGLGGVLMGALLIGIIKGIGIQSSNVFFEILFGGATLRPILSLSSVLWSLLATVGIGVLSSLYPTAVALRISPVRAMQKN